MPMLEKLQICGSLAVSVLKIHNHQVETWHSCAALLFLTKSMEPHSLWIRDTSQFFFDRNTIVQADQGFFDQALLEAAEFARGFAQRGLEVPVLQRRCVKPSLQKWIKTESFMSPRLPFGWLFVPNLCKTTLRWQVLLVIVNILKLVKQHVCGRDLGYQKTLVKPKVCQLICKTL